VFYRALYASLNRMRCLDRYFTGLKRNRRDALRVGGILEETILREGGDDDLVASLGVIVE
jgi:RecB family endonuclease NucS